MLSFGELMTGRWMVLTPESVPSGENLENGGNNFKNGSKQSEMKSNINIAVAKLIYDENQAA